MPWLPEPEPAEPLFEGPLELVAARTRRGSEGERVDFDPRNLPPVVIYPPETWPLLELYPSDALPVDLRTRLEKADFYLVRLRCTFRPTKDDVTIAWARFAVFLLGPDPPLAEQVHPSSIQDEVARSRRFALTPSLKFAAVDVGVGEVAVGFEYKELQPYVSGVIDPPDSPSWDFRPTASRRLEGSQHLHLLLKAPRDTPSARARLVLAAEIEKRRKLLGRARTNQDSTLEVCLWGDA